MLSADVYLNQVARRQLGLFTRRQVLNAGGTDELIRRRLGARRWRAVRRGVYSHAGTPASYEQAVLAVCLASEGLCVASHTTAARLWGLTVPALDAIEVMTTRASGVRLIGVIHHRCRQLTPDDVTRLGRIPVTTAARTLVDCAPTLGGRLARMVDDARRRHLVDIKALAACADRLDGNGRPVGHLRHVLADRLCETDVGGSDAEVALLKVLLEAGLPMPVQQHEVVAGGRRRRLDLAYPERKVGIEFDGFQDHGLSRSTFDDDRARGNDLTALGWRILHCTSNTPQQQIVAHVARFLCET